MDILASDLQDNLESDQEDIQECVEEDSLESDQWDNVLEFPFGETDQVFRMLGTVVGSEVSGILESDQQECNLVSVQGRLEYDQVSAVERPVSEPSSC